MPFLCVVLFVIFFLYSVYFLLKNSVQLKSSGESMAEGLVRTKRLRAVRKIM